MSRWAVIYKHESIEETNKLRLYFLKIHLEQSNRIRPESTNMWTESQKSSDTSSFNYTNNNEIKTKLSNAFIKEVLELPCLHLHASHHVDIKMCDETFQFQPMSEY